MKDLKNVLETRTKKKKTPKNNEVMLYVNVEAQAEVYSNSQSHNTVKYLIGITPSGAVKAFCLIGGVDMPQTR